MDPSHPDYLQLRAIADTVISKAGGLQRIEQEFPISIREVIDSTLDPVRTGRTNFKELVNVEKTFIGLRLEHVFRDMIDVPSGLRDLVINGQDVDVKNTVRSTWTIPPETYRDEEPCILIRSNEASLKCWLGVIFARNAYLTTGANRDGKKSISATGKENILWILDNVSYPAGHWGNIDTQRFRELRTIAGGKARAVSFFRENVGLKVHRSVIQALLYDQKDYMKRLRLNGGARDILALEDIAILSGVYDAPLAKELGYGKLAADEMMSIRLKNEKETKVLKQKGILPDNA
ncbi:NaeI family type II restriction endonuclease [Bartonella sp. LJL80]